MTGAKPPPGVRKWVVWPWYRRATVNWMLARYWAMPQQGDGFLIDAHARQGFRVGQQGEVALVGVQGVGAG